MPSAKALKSEFGIGDLADIRRFIEKTAADLGGNDEAVSELVLATNEAITNIIIHGYGGEPGPIEIVVDRAGQDLVVIIRDKSPFFDPCSFPLPDITIPLEQRGPGGMGILMMRSFVDDLTHRQLGEGGNELALVKCDAVNSTATGTQLFL